MSRKMKVILSLAVLGVFAMLPGSSQAQTNSNVANVLLTAGVTPYVSISVSAAAVNFNLVPGAGPTAGVPSLTVTTNWSLAAPSNIALWGTFTAAATALTDGGGNNIPSSNVLGAVNGGGAAAFTGTGPFGGAGAGLPIYSGGAAAVGTRNDTLDLSIDLTSQPLLPSGTYTGTLSLQAQAI